MNGFLQMASLAAVIVFTSLAAGAAQAAPVPGKTYKVAIVSYIPGDREMVHIKELMTKQLRSHEYDVRYFAVQVLEELQRSHPPTTARTED